MRETAAASPPQGVVNDMRLEPGGKTNTPKSPVILLALLAAFVTSPSDAQVTNFCSVAPATKLESFETNVSVVIIKATTDIGSVAANTGVVSVRCREITDSSTGHKEQGIAIEITQRGQLRDKMLIDYDEIALLRGGIDSISKLNFSATSLDSFDAAYTTKGGFRIAALGTRKTGAIQYGVRDARIGSSPVILSRDEMFRVLGFIDQAKSKLDSLRGG